jgi:hypothetical protein
MKNLLKLSWLLPMVVLLTACPYESVVPIAEPNAPIDANLLGKWYKEGETEMENPSEYYRIRRNSANTYEIIKMEFSSSEETYTSETYISHLTILKDAKGKSYTFLNMKKDGKYYLHRIELVGNSFTLYEVTDNIDEKFNTSAELQTFVKANMHLTFFYNKDEKVYFRGNHDGSKD